MEKRTITVDGRTMSYGDTVRRSWFDSTRCVSVLLANPRKISDSDYEGELIFYGDETTGTTEEEKRVIDTCKDIMAIYNEEDLEDYIEYDE